MVTLQWFVRLCIVHLFRSFVSCIVCLHFPYSSFVSFRVSCVRFVHFLHRSFVSFAAYCKLIRSRICISKKKWNLVLLTKIYPPLPTSVQPISITKTLPIVPTKNERDPPLFTGKLLIKFQNILRNTTQVYIIRHRAKILFSVTSSPITLERQKWKSSTVQPSQAE